MRGDTWCTIKYKEIIFNTQWIFEKWYWMHNEDLGDDISHGRNNWVILLNAQLRLEKWYSILNE